MRSPMVAHSVVLGLLLLLVQRLVTAKGLYSKFTSSKVQAGAPKDYEPYETVAQFLSRFGKDSDLETYEHDEIRRAIKALSKGQSALKSMDGATHQLRNVFKESSSLSSRYEKFLKSKRKKLKEAAKIYEYTRSVERGLQATEILQASSTKDGSRRATYLAEAGLKELKRVEIRVDKLKCIVSVLTPIESAADITTTPQEPVLNNNSNTNTTANSTSSASTSTTTTRTLTKAERALERRIESAPQRFFPGEIIISLTEPSGKESTVISQILCVVTREKPSTVALRSTADDGKEQQDSNDGPGEAEQSEGQTSNSAFMSVQPTYLALACKALWAIEEYIVLPAPVVLDTTEQQQSPPVAGAATDSNNRTAQSTPVRPNRGDSLFEANAKKDSVYIGSRRLTATAPTSTTTPPSTDAPTSQSANRKISAVDRETKPASQQRSLPSRIRIVCHSAGGAVGALLAMVLDGGVLTSTGRTNRDANTGRHSSGHSGSTDNHVVLRSTPDTSDSDSYSASDTVDAQQPLQSPSPSRNHNNIDNHSKIVPDTTDCAALLHYASHYTGLYANRVNCITLGSPPCLSRTTVPRYITSFVCGDDLIPRAQAGALRDLRTRTVKALKSGAGRKGGLAYAMSAGLLGDLSSIAGKPSRDVQQLSIPGRVFFVKPRQLKEGATIQRVLRGNWQEDMLWQLHNILLSKRMLEHHSLDAYIRTLNRC